MAKKLKKKYRILIPAVAAVVVLLLTAIFVFKSVIPNNKYNEALGLMADNQFEKASEIFKELGNFKDSEQLMEECSKGQIYLQAVEEMKSEEYENAIKHFTSISGYKDSKELAEACTAALEEKEYAKLLSDNKLSEAFELLQKIQKTASSDKKKEIDQKLNELAVKFYDAGDYDNALKALDAVADQKTANTEIRQKIEDERREAEERQRAEAEKEAHYQELIELEIMDDASIARAEELINELSDDYDVSGYQGLIDESRSYLGSYVNPNTGSIAVVEILDGAVVMNVDGIVTTVYYPQLTAYIYIDADNYTEYSIHDANTIAAIVIENGNVAAYESYVR